MRLNLPAASAASLLMTAAAAFAGPFADKSAAETATKQLTLQTIEACPIKQIRAAYDAAMSPADTLDTVAIEKEILQVCADRDKLIVELKKGDNELSKLLAPKKIEDDKTKAAKTAEAAQLANAAKAALAKAEIKPAPKKAAPAPAPVQQDPLPSCTTKYAMLSIGAEPGSTVYAIGSVIDEDSGAISYVRAGSSLPGGYKVRTVSAAGITISQGSRSWLLPPNTKTFDADAGDGFYAIAAKTDAATAPAPAGAAGAAALLAKMPTPAKAGQ